MSLMRQAQEACYNLFLTGKHEDAYIALQMLRQLSKPQRTHAFYNIMFNPIWTKEDSIQKLIHQKHERLYNEAANDNNSDWLDFNLGCFSVYYVAHPDNQNEEPYFQIGLKVDEKEALTESWWSVWMNVHHEKNPPSYLYGFKKVVVNHRHDFAIQTFVDYHTYEENGELVYGHLEIFLNRFEANLNRYMDEVKEMETFRKEEAKRKANAPKVR